MKNIFIALALFTLVSFRSVAQNDAAYVTSGLEIIFSKGGTENDGNIRFAPVLNLQSNLNLDLSDKLGVYTGIAVRNVGFIYDDPNNQGTTFKYRTYNIGIPAGIKIGNLEKAFVYGGYELELPFNYKEKQFQNGEKIRNPNFWFSDRVNLLQHSLFVGFQFYSGMNLKFKYYLTSLHDPDFIAYDLNGNPSTPYAGIDSNIWYISLNFAVFRNAKFFYSKSDLGMGEI